MSGRSLGEAQIADLMIYPVKSLPGISCQTVRVTDNGLEGDRQFILAGSAIDDTGVAGRLTLREHPELQRIATELTAQGVLLTARGMDSLVLPFGIEEGPETKVKSWGGLVTGIQVSEKANDWLGTFLGRKGVQILAVPDRHRRTMSEGERKGHATVSTGRATDGYPIHVASLASLRRLNEARAATKLASISMGHFRANIVVDGTNLAPFAEDDMLAMHFEDESNIVDIVAIGACRRCATVEAHPRTGLKLGNVLKSLHSLQSERTTSDELVFGVWAAPSLVSVGGLLRIGQTLRPIF